MARLINAKLVNTHLPPLTASERRTAQRRLGRAKAANPLRRVRLECHGWSRDISAVVGDWVWCGDCADLRPVVEVAE